MSDALKIVTYDDGALAKRALVRAHDAGLPTDPDASLLMHMLDGIDSLKYEIEERMRRVEAVKQARSILHEDQMRSEALNRKLAEISRVMGAAQSCQPAGAHVSESAQPLSPEHRGLAVNAESRHGEHGEGAAIAWPKTEDDLTAALASDTAPNLDPLRDPYEATPDVAEQVAEVSRQALERLAQAEEAWKTVHSQAESAAAQAREAIALELAGVHQRLDQAEQNARRLKEASTQASIESQRLLEESTTQLKHAQEKADRAAAEYLKAQSAFTENYHAANERLEGAERFWRSGDEARVETAKMATLSRTQLEEARSKEEAATFDLISARQELTTAYQFAAVAAQRRLDAAEFFQRSARWAIRATAFSWMAMAWLAWLAFRSVAPIWSPALISALILIAAMFLRKSGDRAPGHS